MTDSPCRGAASSDRRVSGECSDANIHGRVLHRPAPAYIEHGRGRPDGRQCSLVTRGGAGTKAIVRLATSALVEIGTNAEGWAAQPRGHFQEALRAETITSGLPACWTRVSTFGAGTRETGTSRCGCAAAAGTWNRYFLKLRIFFRHAGRKVRRVIERERSESGTTAKPASGSLSRLRCGAHALDLLASFRCKSECGGGVAYTCRPCSPRIVRCWQPPTARDAQPGCHSDRRTLRLQHDQDRGRSSSTATRSTGVTEEQAAKPYLAAFPPYRAALFAFDDTGVKSWVPHLRVRQSQSQSVGLGPGVVDAAAQSHARQPRFRSGPNRHASTTMECRRPTGRTIAFVFSPP